MKFILERIPISVEALQKVYKEEIPVYLKKFFFALGGTPMILFCIQAATGILLTFYYIPSVEHAYSSVKAITHDVPYGWLIRSIHAWTANLFIITIFLHLMRVYFTQAYRKPREITWVFGVGLLFMAVSFGFTGYSLVYDQLAYWAMIVGTNIAGSFPLVGNLLLNFVRGGTEVTANTLTRLYAFHVGGLPTVFFLLLVGHIVLIRLHGIAKPAKDSGKTYHFFPEHFLIETAMALGVFLIILWLAILFPAHLGEPASPFDTPAHIKPEWYFFPAFRWLKIASKEVGILGMVLFPILITLWPFIEAVLEKKWPKVSWNKIMGIPVFMLIFGLGIWEALSH